MYNKGRLKLHTHCIRNRILFFAVSIFRIESDVQHGIIAASADRLVL
jgi:hypothetical protein